MLLCATSRLGGFVRDYLSANMYAFWSLFPSISKLPDYLSILLRLSRSELELRRRKNHE